MRKCSGPVGGERNYNFSPRRKSESGRRRRRSRAMWCDCAEGEKGRLELIRRDNFRHAKRKQIIRRQITQRPRTKCEMQPQRKCLFLKAKWDEQNLSHGLRSESVGTASAPNSGFDGKKYSTFHISQTFCIWN